MRELSAISSQRLAVSSWLCVEGLHHLAIMTGLGSPRLAGQVAETLWKVCWHFVGPDKVSMNRADLGLVLECVDALGALAEFNCMVGHGRKAARIIAAQLENYSEVGLWYRQRRIVSAVADACAEALRECYTEGKVDFKPGLTTLRRSVRRMRRGLARQQPGWHVQSRRLGQLLRL
jgi:hypothetical protein